MAIVQRVRVDPEQRRRGSMAASKRFRVKRRPVRVTRAPRNQELAPDGLNAGLLGEYDACPAAFGPDAPDGLNAGLLGEYDAWPTPCPEAPDGLNAGLVGEYEAWPPPCPEAPDGLKAGLVGE